MGGCMYVCKDGWMDEFMDECMHACVHAYTFFLMIIMNHYSMLQS